MAKTVGDLLIKLGVDGIEGVNVLKSSLTALGKAAGPTDKNIRKIRTEILEFANAGQKSTQAIKGVVESFKGLQAQASIGSSVYRQLAADVEALEGELKSLTPEAQKAAKAIRAFGPSKVPDAFVEDMKARRRELQGIAVDSDKYLEKLVAIKNFESQQAARVGRQEVSAAARVARTGVYSNIVQSEQPATLAALRLRIGEVQNEVENLDFTTKDYADANKELIALQQSLSEALGGTSSSFDRLGDAQTRAARRAEKLAGIQAAQAGQAGARNPQTGTPMAGRDPSTGVMIAGGSAVSAIPTPLPELSSLYKGITQIETAGVNASLDRMGKSVKQVTRDINAATAASNGSVNSLQSQRSAMAQLRAGLDPTSQDFRELGVQIEKVDRRLEKLNKRRRRFTAKGFASGMAGVAAGGIFGGPEGAIGGAIGGAVGGVAGVAAGAAIGAQAKMLREALGATSEYAAQLQKLEIALEGVAGPEYTDALKAANQVTKDFNVPIAVSTKGITRLSAAVVGAGGNVDDAEVVFRNITSAIKATGGGAQDVESAITAMVQTFSKGKVSAEELSGQLGERLPGAVTKFAEANNMTLPELQKSLKAGTVGLDELMKFIISLGPEYEETARAIADSSADAGARAAVAFEQVRREIGEALQPIGADLQKAFGKFVLDILPAIKKLAVLAANGLKALLDVSAFLIANFKELLIVAGAAGVAFALQNLIGIATALGTAFGKATVAMKGFTAASLLNPWVALAAGITAATVAIVKYSKKNAEFNKSVIAGETTNEQANDRLREMNEKVKELQDRLETEGNGRMIRQLKNQLKAAKIAADDLKLAMALASSYEVAGIKYDRMTGLPIDAPSSYTPHDYDDPTPDPTGDADKDISFEMAQARINAMREVITLADVEAKLANDLLQISLDDLKTNEELVAKAQAHNDAENARIQIQKQLQDLQASLQEQLDKALLATGQITQEEFNQNELSRKREELMERYLPLLLDEKMTREEILEVIEKIIKGEAEGQKKTKSFVDGLKELIEESTNLNDILAEYGVQAIDKFANAFADFVATGKLKFKEFAASVLKDLSRIFVKAAFFNAIAGVFPSLKPTTTNANGNAFTGSGVVAFAKGGVVSKPTAFQYADGASGSFGLMGEAGAEAIMPLKRGPSGRLGVEVNNQGSARDAMNRYSRRSAGAAGGGVATEDEAIAAVQGSSAAIDVRYSVERINNVDYVTADQFQQGLQQAAAQGAQRGEQQTLRRLQMSSSTRRRIGV